MLEINGLRRKGGRERWIRAEMGIEVGDYQPKVKETQSCVKSDLRLENAFPDLKVVRLSWVRITFLFLLHCSLCSLPAGCWAAMK